MTAAVIRGARSLRAASGAALTPLATGEWWRSALYLVAGAGLSLLSIGALVVGVVVGGATAGIGVGVLLLVVVLLAGRGLAEVERRLINAFLDADITPPRRATGRSHERRAVLLLKDGSTWRAMLWLLFRACASTVFLVGVASCAVAATALIAVPFVDGYLSWGGSWQSEAGWASAWTLPLGVLAILGVVHAVPLIAQIHQRVAVMLLGPDPADRLAGLQEEAARREEQLWLSRELHDTVGHALTLVAVQAEVARLNATGDPAAADLALVHIGETTRAALGELDATLAALRTSPSAQAPMGPTLSDLPGLVQDVRATGVPVEASALPAGAARHPGSSIAYRVVQEGCTNAMRHAPGQPISIAVDRLPGRLLVTIGNPLSLRPSSPPPGSRRGLAGLGERVRLAGGEFSAGRQTDGRWLVSASLPDRLR